jgi:hypothetical protein
MIAIPRKNRRSRVERLTEAVANCTGGKVPPEVAAEIAKMIDGEIPADFDVGTVKATTVDIADTLKDTSTADTALLLNAATKCLAMLLPKIANSSAAYKTVSHVARRKVQALHDKLGSKTYLDTLAALLRKTPDNVSPENVGLIVTQAFLLELRRLAAVAGPDDKG